MNNPAAGRKKKIAVYGGSFNPVHNGHIMLANFTACFGPVDEVLIMVSPKNPLKTDMEMASDDVRLEMARLAFQGLPGVRVSDFEMSLPRPSYTEKTLRALSRRYPEIEFSLLIGADNWQCFDEWKDTDYILSSHPILVYPRPGIDFYSLHPKAPDRCPHASVTYLDRAPIAEISSTFIRKNLAQGRDMRGFIPESVASYINANNIYNGPSFQ